MFVYIDKYKIPTDDKYFPEIVKYEIKSALLSKLANRVVNDRMFRSLLKTHNYLKDKILSEFAKECYGNRDLSQYIEQLYQQYMTFLENWDKENYSIVNVDPMPPYAWTLNALDFEMSGILDKIEWPSVQELVRWCKKNDIEVIDDEREIVNIMMSNMGKLDDMIPF